MPRRACRRIGQDLFKPGDSHRAAAPGSTAHHSQGHGNHPPTAHQPATSEKFPNYFEVLGYIYGQIRAAVGSANRRAEVNDRLHAVVASADQTVLALGGDIDPSSSGAREVARLIARQLHRSKDV